MVLNPILPQHRQHSSWHHIVTSHAGTSARGNHVHSVGEVLVFMHGTWIMRVATDNNGATEDFIFSGNKPVAVEFGESICNAVMNVGDDTGWLFAYYLNDPTALIPVLKRCDLNLQL